MEGEAKKGKLKIGHEGIGITKVKKGEPREKTSCSQE